MNTKLHPNELAELRARLYERILKNINLRSEACTQCAKSSNKDVPEVTWERLHIQALQRRVGDLEALAFALMAIIDPDRVMDSREPRLDHYYNDDQGGGASQQEQLHLTDRGNIRRGGEISCDDFLTAIVHLPHYFLHNGRKGVSPGTPPVGEAQFGLQEYAEPSLHETPLSIGAEAGCETTSGQKN